MYCYACIEMNATVRLLALVHLSEAILFLADPYYQVLASVLILMIIMIMYIYVVTVCIQLMQ